MSGCSNRILRATDPYVTQSLNSMTWLPSLGGYDSHLPEQYESYVSTDCSAVFDSSTGASKFVAFQGIISPTTKILDLQKAGSAHPDAESRVTDRLGGHNDVGSDRRTKFALHVAVVQLLMSWHKVASIIPSIGR